MTSKRKLGGVLAVAAAVAAVFGVASLRSSDVAAQSEIDAQALRRMQVGGSVHAETDFIAGARIFEPGNRTYWHAHAGGFILFVHEGKARVQTRGAPMRELGVGEIDYTPAGVEHWHGAAPDTPLVQLGVVPYGGGIEFLEPVSDAQYNGQAR